MANNGTRQDERDRPEQGGSFRSARQLAADTEDLTLAIAGVSGLLAGALDLEVLLTRVAQYAVQAIPGADGAGVTMLDDDASTTVAASDDFVHAVDDIQYHLDEGPCVSAASERQSVRSGSLGSDRRWPRFGPRAGRLGVHSALSVPMLLPDSTLGAINIYAHAKDAFGPRAAELAELFIQSATVAVHNARILAQARRQVAQLQNALTTRATIDQAIGIIRSRTGASPEEAFDSLKRISQRDNVKLNRIAQHMVDEAVRRARSRHS
jgi:GAF domain-containing protein